MARGPGGDVRLEDLSAERGVHARTVVLDHEGQAGRVASSAHHDPPAGRAHRLGPTREQVVHAPTERAGGVADAMRRIAGMAEKMLTAIEAGDRRRLVSLLTRAKKERDALGS